MAFLTIYNHGTGVDQNVKHHNITKLFKETATMVGDNVFVTQGVGSTYRIKRSVPIVGNLAALIGGNLFGYANDSAVGAALQWVMERHQALNGDVTGINICGYSRGGATCFKQANLLSKNTNPAIRAIPVSIFAIDPVPGCMGKLNSHMYRDLEIENNVDQIFVVLAECERRKTFRPVLHSEIVQGKGGKFLYDTMPGNHCGIVEQKAEGEPGGDSPRLVYDLAKHHLGRWGTEFSENVNNMTDQERLGRYARVMLQFDEYIAMGQKKMERLMGGMTTDRIPRQQKGTGSFFYKNNWHGSKDPSVRIHTSRTGQTSRYFANNQHKELFRQQFPGAGAILTSMERGNFSNSHKLHSLQSPEVQSLNPFFNSGPWGQLASEHFNRYLHMWT